MFEPIADGIGDDGVTDDFAPRLWQGRAGDQRIVSDPIDLPGLASIIRERLLKVAGRRAHFADRKSNQNVSFPECFLVDEFAATIVN